MGGKSSFKNWMIDAYLAGDLENIPENLLSLVKDIAERRKAYQAEVAESESEKKPDYGFEG